MVVLQFRGCNHFRLRLICAILSGKSIRIKDIRADDDEPGLKDFEASFLRLLDKITNGTIIEINHTGTEIFFKGGILIGGEIEHTCPLSRSISYFLEAMLYVAPFVKKDFKITFAGITNDNLDMSVDYIRTVLVPLMQQFEIETDESIIEIKINKRGAPPKGGGEVYFSCPNVKELTPVYLTEEGQISKIRGIAYCTRVSPQFSTRLGVSAKETLQPFLNNIFIRGDHYKGAESGLSPGFGLILVGESDSGARVGAEYFATPGELPEDCGVTSSLLLLDEILKGGYIDTAAQPLAIMYMTLCPEDVSKIKTGKLSLYAIGLLRLIRDFFGIKFKITEDEFNENCYNLSCKGIGYKNVSKKFW